LIFLVLTIVTPAAWMQESVEKIRKNKENTLKEIDFANKMLEETKGKTKQSLIEIDIINEKLRKRKVYINNLETEADIVEGTIAEKQKEIEEIQMEIERLKSNYALMVVQNYKRKWDGNFMYYILASENINEFYRRIRFVKVYNSYIKSQKEKLEDLLNVLTVKTKELVVQKEEKDNLIKTTRNEYVKIKKESEQKKEVLNDLKKKQEEIERDIKEKEKVAKRLDNEISKILEGERKKIPKGSPKSYLTPAEQIISGDFEKNKGKLPWPMQRGFITGKYGEHEHPDFKSVKVRNDGIYISSARGEPVRAIFKGVVSKVFSIPGQNYTVIIKHGNYFTLYHNLVDVTVKAGQSVDTKEAIGKVFTDNETKESTLYFQVWKEMERNDPELWLAH